MANRSRIGRNILVRKRPQIDYSKYPLGQCEHIHADGRRCIQPAYVEAVGSTITNYQRRKWCIKCHQRNHAVKGMAARSAETCPRCKKHTDQEKTQ